MKEESPFAALLKRWDRHIDLSEDDRRAVLALPYTRRALARDAYLVREGQHTDQCILLVAGSAYRQKLVETGGRQIISVHIPGELIDAQQALLAEADHNVQSLGPSEVAFIPKPALINVMAERPQVGRAVWFDTLIDASIFREWVVNVGRRNARTRIAHLLCELSLRFRGAGLSRGDLIRFPLTQEQIADATGLTPVHTNRTLQALRQERLIELRAMHLRVLDWQRLVEVGDFSERYLHQNDRIAEAGWPGAGPGGASPQPQPHHAAARY